MIHFLRSSSIKLSNADNFSTRLVDVCDASFNLLPRTSIISVTESKASPCADIIRENSLLFFFNNSSKSKYHNFVEK